MDWRSLAFMVGAILINLTLGTFYSIGNLIPYIASYMRASGNPTVTIEDGTYITASFLMGQGLAMIMGAHIEKNCNNRVACIIGCILHCSSTYLTIWAINVNFPLVILIYGLGSGLGCGSSYIASIIAAQRWFPHRKGLYTGMIVAGFGFGGLIFTPLQTLYLNPNNIKANPKGYFDEQVYNKVPTLFLYMGIIFTVAQSIGCLLAFPPPSLSSDDRSNANTNAQDLNQTNTTTIITEESLPEMKGYTDAFNYKIFYLIGLMMMLVAPGVTFVNSLGKRYGQSYIEDDTFLATVVAVSAVANAVGRLFWGFIMDKYSFSTCYSIKVVLFSLLITLFPFGFILSSKTLYLISMLGLFFGFSGTFVLFPLFIEQVFGHKYHGCLYGILYLALASASIITSILIQFFLSPALEDSKSADDSLMIRLGPCLIIAALYLLSWILYIVIIPVRRLENAISRRTEMNNIRANKNSLYNRSDLYPLERGTLADRTALNDATGSRNSRSYSAGGSPRLERENSLGSIVRFRDGPKEIKKMILNLMPKN